VAVAELVEPVELLLQEIFQDLEEVELEEMVQT
jgi:hypothetical protein